MAQTYQTRVLTARDHQLIDALERDPRYRRVAAMLRPPAPAKAKAKPAPADPVADDGPVAGFDDDDREPPRRVGRPRKDGG